MKDITRIHIAKVAYSVELDAKKSLEKYLDTLDAYSDDKELLNDIEIRITELLADRGIKAEGVIGESDVTAIRDQLGEPKDFMDDGSSVDTIVLPKEKGRKLYRNLDNVMIGGVLSGTASYFGIKPLWTRLAFIVLTIITSGLSILLYVVLWAVIPSAKTAADKLQMQGRAVTLASIRELNDSPIDEYTKIRNAQIRHFVLILVGLGFIGLALAIICIYVTVWIHYTNTFNGQTQTYFPISGDVSVADPIYLGAFIVSGISLMTLCIIAAFAAFGRKLTRRKIIGGLIIIVATGLIVGGAYGFEMYKEWQVNQQAVSNTKEMHIKVPDGFNMVNSLVANIPAYIDVTYIVDPSSNSITFKSTKGLTLATSVTDKTATISFNPANQPATVPMSSITIHGPELDTITTQNTHLTYQSKDQTNLVVKAQSSAVFLAASYIKAVTVTLNEGSNLIADSSSIESADISVNGTTYVRFGTIKTLNVTNPDACAVDTQATIQLHSIRDSTYTHNGTAIVNTQPFNDDCMQITIDSQLVQ